MKDAEKYNKISATGCNVYAICVDESSEIDEELVKTTKLMPDIVNVREVENADRKVVIVYFADNTKTKAVLCPGDTYSFEQGMSICIMKRILTEITGGNGSAIYNKLVKHGYNVIKNNKIAAEKAEQERLAAIEREKKEAEQAEREMRRFANYVAEIIIDKVYDEDDYEYIYSNDDEDDDSEMSYADLMATMHDMGFGV